MASGCYDSFDEITQATGQLGWKKVQNEWKAVQIVWAEEQEKGRVKKIRVNMRSRIERR